MKPTSKNIPWFKEFAGEVLSDLRYQALSDEGKGQRAHLRLLCWRHGSIPADEKVLSRPPYCTGPVLSEVLAMFSKRGNKLIDSALERQRDTYTEKCRKNAENGRRGGRYKKTQEDNENRSVSDGFANAANSRSEAKPEEKKEEKREMKSLAHAVSSRSSDSEKSGASQSRLSVEKAIGKIAEQKDTGLRKGMTQKELQERAEFLESQKTQVFAKFGG